MNSMLCSATCCRACRSQLGPDRGGRVSKRRPLVDGVKARKPADPEMEAAFVFGQGEGRGPNPPVTTSVQEPKSNEPSRLPLTTRLRVDLVKGLKRAALERQLDGVEPNTVQEILEEALEPWLRRNGVLK